MAVEAFTEICGNPIFRRKRVVVTCDECGDKPDEIYQYDGTDFCLNCFVNHLLNITEYKIIEAE